MSITLESTTDSIEAVNAALGGVLDSKKVEDNNSVSSHEEQDEAVENSEDSKEDAKESDEEEVKEDANESEEKEEEQKPKKKGGFQKKIEKYEKQLSVSEQEKEAAKQEVEYWKQKALGEKPQEVEPKKVEAKIDDKKPNPNDFETHVEYVDALTDWKIDRRELERAQKEKEQEVVQNYQSRLKSYHDKVDEFKTTVKDFDDVVKNIGNVKVSSLISDAIISSDLGPQLYYELSKNKSELDRINSLPDYKALIEIGKFEERISKASVKKETAVVSKAPAPISPVNTSSSGKAYKDPDKMNLQEYKQWRAETKSRY